MTDYFRRQIIIVGAALFAAFATAPITADASDFDVPEIASRLPANSAEAEAIFIRRVSSAFPRGTAEEELMRDLRRQGFTLVSGKRNNEPYRYFEYTKPGVPCKTVWRIFWDVNKGKITDTDALYGRICL